ncbi:hypothetical protein ACKLNO_02885 [Neisseriaceae bacterium B1]
MRTSPSASNYFTHRFCGRGRPRSKFLPYAKGCLKTHFIFSGSLKPLQNP